MPEALEVDHELAIPLAELSFAASRSGGPGGQHVNKVSTRVTLYFDVELSPSLTDEQRGRLRERLATRIGKDGRLRVTASRHRSQAANRWAATERFVELLREALVPEVPRRPTRVPARARRRRLEEKRRQGERKRARRQAPPDSD